MSKARKTSDVFDEQDALGRTYATPNDPHADADKQRLGDTWLVENAGDVEISTLVETETQEAAKLKRTAPVENNRLLARKKRSLNKYTRYHHKKEY